MLAKHESRPSGGAGLLTIGVGERRPFPGGAVEVGRTISYHTTIVGADIVPADVIAPVDEDVRLSVLRQRGAGPDRAEREREDGDTKAPQPAI
jgi:hypothetical protein